MIHGRNFLLNFNGEWKKAGFYVPRYANAPDEIMAEHVALEEFRHNPRYKELLKECLNAEVQHDPPTLCGEDIEHTTLEDDFPNGPPGFVFYTD